MLKTRRKTHLQKTLVFDRQTRARSSIVPNIIRCYRWDQLIVNLRRDRSNTSMMPSSPRPYRKHRFQIRDGTNVGAMSPHRQSTTHISTADLHPHIEPAQPAQPVTPTATSKSDTAASNSTGLFQLNTFVALQILERLDVLSVIAFQTVCQPSDSYADAFQIFYRSRCQDFEFSFDALRGQRYVTDRSSQTDLLFERIGPYVQRLQIRGYMLNCDMSNMNRLLAAHCSALHHLHLRGHRLFDKRTVYDETQVRGLRSLKLELLSVNNAHIRRYVECNVETLESIDFCDVTNFPGALLDIERPPRLKRISVSCSDLMRPDGLIEYLGTQPGLEEFELNFSISCGPIEFREICARLPGVRALNLCASNLGGHLAHVAALERLERLRLSTYDDMNGLLVQLAMRDALRELCVDGSYGRQELDSITLAAFVGFTRLRRLRLYCCDFVSGAMLAELGVMAGLEELELVRCDNCGAAELVGYVAKLGGLRMLTLEACRMQRIRSEVRRLQWLAMDRGAGFKLRLL